MKHDTTKDKILSAALVEFLTKGYERTSMNDIVKRSGVTKGGIYHHFNGKEALFYEIIAGYLHEMVDWTSHLVEQSSDARELFETFFRSIGQIEEIFFKMVGVRGISAFNYFQMVFEAMSRFPDLRTEMGQTYRDIQEQVAAKLRESQKSGVIRDDVDVESIAFSFNALYEGTIMIGQVDETAHDKLHRYIKNLWHIITTRQSG